MAKSGSPTRSCTELARLPSERITENALGALKMACRAVARQSEGWSARDDLHPPSLSSYGGAGVQGCLILSQVGLLFRRLVISCMRDRCVG
jgi:hypothetical protein